MKTVVTICSNALLFCLSYSSRILTEKRKKKIYYRAKWDLIEFQMKMKMWEKFQLRGSLKILGKSHVPVCKSSKFNKKNYIIIQTGFFILYKKPNQQYI